MAKLTILMLALVISSLECANIEEIFNRMSLEDKCGQMTQVTFQVIETLPRPPLDSDDSPIDINKLITAIRDKKVGSILNTPYDLAAKKGVWQKMIQQIHDTVQNYTELKIPVIYGIDSIHGANYIREATLFPQPLSLAATFNVNLAFRDGGYTAMETRAVGIPWNFNPVLDVGRQPLWPRLWETYGEDPYLASQMGQNYIRGHQGNDLKNRTFAATCLKHYIGYSYPFNGLDRSIAYIPETLLREKFLPPFEAGVAAGSLTVMVNSGDVNGIPGHANGFYINDILKGELNFQGFVVSDWEDIVRLHTRDKVAETPEEAVRIAVMNGLDMSMVPYDFSFYDHCVNLTKKNPAFIERVNDATMRILRVKDTLGLFESNVPFPQDLDKVGTDETWDFALESAREAIILAKNQANILPLSNTSRILVTGPTGDLLKVLHGGWSYTWQGNNESDFQLYGRKKYTVYEMIKLIAPAAQVTYVPGVTFTDVIDIQAVITAAQTVDTVLLCIGEDTYTETPGNINNLALSEPQQQLADALFFLGKPVVVVYIGGRPRIMTNIAERARGVVLGFLPGNRGGEAIAEVLFARINPSGRLPITYPANVNGYTTYDYLPIESFDLNRYDPLYPFGHGLSYTTFTYSTLEVVMGLDQNGNTQTVTISTQVTNTGNREGKETVLLFINDEYGSMPRPERQLKGFNKVNLAPGQSIQVSFTLSMNDLSFINSKNERVYEAGYFNAYIGNMSARFNVIVNTITTTTNSVLTPTPGVASKIHSRFIIVLTGLLLLFRYF